MLVVDQCEEAFRPTRADERERAEFLAALLEHAERAPVVVTLRADRVGELAGHPAFARRVEQGLYLLAAMSPEDLRRSIEGPAAQAGLRLEPGLVDLLVRDVEGEPGALPLLSHALRETWERREGRTLTVAAYQQSGGIRESVAQSAEEVVRALPPSEQEALRELMLRLVVLNDDGEAVRTHLPRKSLPPSAQGSDLVERLVAARLVAADDDGLEVAHEALVRAWPRLRSWLDDDVEGLRTMRHLSVAAESWDDLGRPDSELYRGGRLERAVEWSRRASPALTVTEREFLDGLDGVGRRGSTRRPRSSCARSAGSTGACTRASRRWPCCWRSRSSRVPTATTAADRADRQATVADARRLGAEALRDPGPGPVAAARGGGGRPRRLGGDAQPPPRRPWPAGRRSPAALEPPGPIFDTTVNTSTGQLARGRSPGSPLELYDGQSLRRVAVAEGPPRGRVSPAARTGSCTPSRWQ